jgi:hypothetical protein
MTEPGRSSQYNDLAMVWMAEELEKQEIFSFPQGSDQFGAHPAFCPIGMGHFFPGS